MKKDLEVVVILFVVAGLLLSLWVLQSVDDLLSGKKSEPEHYPEEWYY